MENKAVFSQTIINKLSNLFSEKMGNFTAQKRQFVSMKKLRATAILFAGGSIMIPTEIFLKLMF